LLFHSLNPVFKVLDVVAEGPGLPAAWQSDRRQLAAAAQLFQCSLGDGQGRGRLTGREQQSEVLGRRAGQRFAHGVGTPFVERRASMALSSWRTMATARRSYSRKVPARADGRMCRRVASTRKTRCRGACSSAAMTPGVMRWGT